MCVHHMHAVLEEVPFQLPLDLELQAVVITM